MFKDERGQVLIIFSLLMATVIASLSILHAQNLLAGVESSRALMVFPKEDIRNLKQIAKNDLKNEFSDSRDKLIDRSQELNKQIQILYATKGTFGSLEVIPYTIETDSNNDVKVFKVKVVYSDSEVEYIDTFRVRK